jgi:hypothetical protein
MERKRISQNKNNQFSKFYNNVVHLVKSNTTRGFKKQLYWFNTKICSFGMDNMVHFSFFNIFYVKQKECGLHQE